MRGFGGTKLNSKMENKFKPTFPCTPNRPWDDESENGYLGLDKREHFALHLMAALISNADRHSQQGDCQTWNYEHLSEIAIQAADALLSKLEVYPNTDNQTR